ncbi:Rhodanese-like protein [Obba rivulosa]|uniref:Rhodanese-like protein n=1 Tax=Obba rivulosa TaxID=1052685 RepID=A0A8E2J7I4_9APHY|nr:Rhodanese-like protein [Obba rivulosa]
MSSSPTPLVLKPAEVAAIQPRNPGDLVVLDASWHMPNSLRKAREDFRKSHILGSYFLDLDEVASSHPLGLKHMMPSPELFAQTCEQFGIRPDSHVVLYDTHGVFSSPRALFMFRSFGHERSSILDGGFPAWRAANLPTAGGEPAPLQRSSYPTAALHPDVVVGYDDIVTNENKDPDQDTSAFIVLDARSQGRFLATDPEPRPGLPSGHIPHSFSLPFQVFLNAPNEVQPYVTLRTPEDMRSSLENVLPRGHLDAILEGRRKVATSCGSGMTAGILWLGLQTLGAKAAIYDESWTGYAMHKLQEKEQKPQ